MALNYSHRPIFPDHISEDNLVSPMRIANGYLMEGVTEKNGEGYSRPRHTNRGEIEDPKFYCGGDRVDRSSSPESTSRDIIDLLPSDPFGMDMETTFTAITGWLEDLEVDYGVYMRSNGSGSSQETYDLLSRWNFIWNNAITLQSFQSNVWFNEKFDVANHNFPSNNQDKEKSCVGIHSLSSSVPFDDKLDMSSEVNHYEVERDMGGASTSYKVEGAANFEGFPHDALNYALSYLELKDLLTVERVCKSLKSTVRGDPLLWMSIHIDRPVNERITDDILVQLVSRAQGSLKCLTVVDCPKVTDEGLRRILEKNHRLTKLSVPGCTRLSISNIMKNLKTYNSNKNVSGIKHLRIGGIFGVTREHFKELKLMLGVGREKLHKSHLYHQGNLYLPCDDDRAIDIDMCPKCEKIKLVYDCPAEECRVKEESGQSCRGCVICIARCAQCGRCINDSEYEETFCLQLLCSECCKGMPEYQEKKIEPSGALRLNIESR